MKLNEIDKRTQLIIFGFVRESQKILPCNTSFYTIPSLIIHIILSFYFEADYFDKFASNIEITEDGKKMRVKSANGWVNVYGKIEIDSMSDICCYWKIKIIKKTSNMFIGIVFSTILYFI